MNLATLGIYISMALEPEGLSPSTQEPATSPFSEPPESIPHPLANFSKIHSDPIPPSTRRSSELSLSFGLSHQNFVHFSLSFHACHTTRPPNSTLLDGNVDIYVYARYDLMLVNFSSGFT
jgi:hypothetical protein